MSPKLPGFLQSCLWSYDLTKVNPKTNTGIIITQVLNWGGRQQLDWLFENYNEDEIKRVMLHPSRGVWLRDKFRYWLNKFDMLIDPLEFEVAIRDLDFRPRLQQMFFERKGLL